MTKRSLAAAAAALLRPYGIEIAVVSVVALLLIRYVDLPLALRLSSTGVTDSGALLEAVSQLGRGEYYLAFGIPGLLLGGWMVHRQRTGRHGWTLLHAGALITGTLAVGHLLVFLLKQTVARLRPLELMEDGSHGFADPFSGEPFTSLPSSHAFTAFAMAAVLSRLRPELRAVFFGLALVVAVQRMMAHHHFLSDIFISLFLALMVSEAVQAAWARSAPLLARRLSL
ncbi:MAG: phosphatase PAP2 family protein [Ferrovibrio sp.]|uniref:phosphatase PAP2 family protein n=1 Tax=Ferrovibrio sp. TaxID=1917215 RepID=UPI0026355679|nr:phosphatase PAP2 family protein [Ferrovibrio sp.]MCW0234308.1 phosphatase PAP2 family protein [Ferrovibrio sp.]